MDMNEGLYQRGLINRIENMFPDCVVLKNDPKHVQGIPDVIVLYRDRWAMLEVKMDATSDIQPNQEYYVKLFGDMSFASFINPDNEKEVLDELQHSFGITRQARLFESQ
jgi:hypothetical protein